MHNYVCLGRGFWSVFRILEHYLKNTVQRHLVSLSCMFIEGSTKLRIRGWRPTTKIEGLQYAKLEEDR